jgi:CTP:molybdopterin cytidylyltransferase MocA
MGHHGLLLAAGAGTRMGMPKALMRDPDGTSWLRRTVAVLQEGGCEAVTVVLGAGADRATALLEGGAAVVVAEDWSEGMGASLRAGLLALAGSDAVGAVVMLVDLPDVTAEVVRQVAARVTEPAQLARASYDGRPGHPVVIGRAHWVAVADSVTGDQGARDYLASQGVLDVECSDLATGRDRDSPRTSGP